MPVGPAETFYKEAMEALDRGDWERARGLLASALWHAPADNDAKFGLARAVEGLGDHRRAQELLQEIHDSEPSHAGAGCRLAAVYLTYEADGIAEQVLNRVLAAWPDHPAANLWMAKVLQRSAEGRSRARRHAEAAMVDPACRPEAETLLAQLPPPLPEPPQQESSPARQEEQHGEDWGWNPFKR